jgi:hypothetical protein
VYKIQRFITSELQPPGFGIAIRGPPLTAAAREIEKFAVRGKIYQKPYQSLQSQCRVRAGRVGIHVAARAMAAENSVQ